MKENVIKSDEFFLKKRAFFEARNVFRKKSFHKRDDVLREWKHLARRSDAFLSKKEYWYDVLNRKSSQDGLLHLGFELGEVIHLQNPLMYAPSCRGATRRRNFLKNLLADIFS